MNRYSQKSFLDRVKRNSGSTKSVNSAKTSLVYFNRFCDSVYGKTPEVVVSELKISIKENPESLYQFIDDVSSFLCNTTKRQSNIPNQKLSVGTIKHSLTTIKQFLRHSGISIDSNMEKQFVTVPKQVKERIEPVTLPELQRIVDSADKKRKLLYIVLLSSGMRIGECLRIKKSHIKFADDIIQISISGKIAKNGHGRITFVSEECRELLKSRLSEIDVEDFAFTNGSDLEQNERTESQYLLRLCKKLGLDDYETDDKIKHMITLHKFRKYFSGIATSNGMMMEYKQSLTGWDSFVGTYHQFSVEELAREYKKIESSLFITQEFRQKSDLKEKDLVIEKMQLQAQKITSLESALDQIRAHMKNIPV